MGSYFKTLKLFFSLQIEFYFYYNGGKHKRSTQHFTYSTISFIADTGGYMVIKLGSFLIYVSITSSTYRASAWV